MFITGAKTAGAIAAFAFFNTLVAKFAAIPPFWRPTSIAMVRASTTFNPAVCFPVSERVTEAIVQQNPYQ